MTPKWNWHWKNFRVILIPTLNVTPHSRFSLFCQQDLNKFFYLHSLIPIVDLGLDENFQKFWYTQYQLFTLHFNRLENHWIKG